MAALAQGQTVPGPAVSPTPEPQAGIAKPAGVEAARDTTGTLAIGLTAGLLAGAAAAAASGGHSASHGGNGGASGTTGTTR